MIPIVNIDRNCEGCTVCCEGWTTGEVYGHYYQPGIKCHFLNTQDSECSIYEKRPQTCRDFKCLWLTDKAIPEWFKPSISKVYLLEKSINNVKYILAKEAGQKMDSEFLSWLFVQHKIGNIPNLSYEISGGMTHLGSDEFIEAMRNNKDIL